MTAEDLADDVVLHPWDDTLDWERLPGRPALERPATTADAVQLVAAGAGSLVVPQSLARLHHRKDLTHRPVTDAPSSRVALSWLEEETTDLMEQFIGIVRGRTPNSTRGRPSAPTPSPARAKAWEPGWRPAQRHPEPKPRFRRGRPRRAGEASSPGLGGDRRPPR